MTVDLAEELDRAERLDQVATAALTLSPRHLRVVEARRRGETLAVVGAALGVGEERARQIEKEAHGALRERLTVAVGGGA